MGKQSRAKRERRMQGGYAASLTNCAGTWLERAPDAEEVARVTSAVRAMAQHRGTQEALHADRTAFNQFSLNMYRDPRWEPLYFDDWMIEQILQDAGEPPIVINNEDPAFSNYLLHALSVVDSPRLRRAMAEQSRRFLPQYVENGQIREALAIEHNAYMTVMSNAATPLLVQALVGALARWYEEHEEDETAETPATEQA